MLNMEAHEAARSRHDMTIRHFPGISDERIIFLLFTFFYKSKYTLLWFLINPADLISLH